MNNYQQKWLDVLTNAHIAGWEIKPAGEDIILKVPDNQSIKTIADNMETVMAQLSLDINLPKERLKFILKNSREEVDYVLNPNETDRSTDKDL